jgi:PIN domain nuclease of toxin-antitoxin system
MNDAPLLLDTHIWFRYQVTPRLVRVPALEAIDRAAVRNDVFVSAISVWELAMLERDGKLDLYGGVDRWSQAALSKPGINLLPLSPQISIASVYLPDPMHKDPADRILVASARVERMTLVTSDKNILAFAKATAMSCLRG